MWFDCIRRKHLFELTYPHDQNAGASGQKNEVSDKETDDPDHGEADVDELETLTSTGEEVPALKNKIKTISLFILSSAMMILLLGI